MQIRKLIRYIEKNIKNIISEQQLRRKFSNDFEEYNKIAGEHEKALENNLYPCLFDSTTLTDIEPVYFYQDSWAFDLIYKNKPQEHIDIGSSHKLVSFLSKITHLTMIDIRPLSLEMPSIHFKEGDILNLPYENETISSLSSICVIEHIGLGRYGDKLDPKGTVKAIAEIDRVLCKGGDLYISVPIEGHGKTYFNAHRSFNEKYLLEELFGNYNLMDKKYIYEQSFGDKLDYSKFGVGCYYIKKKY